MSALEKLAPPLAECKKIPAGEFSDSALVWMHRTALVGLTDEPFLVTNRLQAEHYKREMYPAPTIDEIGAAFPGGMEVNYNEQYVRAIGYECNGEGMHEAWCDEGWSEQKTPAAAALRLLARVRKGEVERC